MNITKWYKKLYLHSKEKIQTRHLAKYGCDLKCPCCNEWFSVSGVEYKHVHEAMSFGSACTCGQCGTKSYWNMEAAPVPLLSDENGVPI